MKLTIIIGQCFGLNPVLGVCEIDTSKLRFTYFSGRCIYSIISIIGQGALLLFCILRFVRDSDATLASNTFLVFYGSNFITVLLFLRIATKWPKLCQIISKTEASDPCTDVGVIRKCNISCVLVLILAIIEHVLSDLSGAALALDCHPNNRYEAFIKNSFPWVFVFLPYNYVIAFLSQILNIQCTFNWNYADLFVICISFYLTSRLEQVNRKIVAAKEKKPPSSFWRATREEYNRATNLVRCVDDVISGIIFITFANNLFFICLQLLHTLSDGIQATPSCRLKDVDVRPLKGYEQAMYFVYSFIFLVLRSLAVSLVAAQVHTSSKKPAYELYEVPSSVYCVEIQRFLDQIHGETVALSGLQFFNVKRGLVLAIAGTIVTYELVLLQVTGVTPTSPPPTILTRSS
ncbi:gustatory receptor for sugar taste 64e-like [Epargyreus clarus]|uniref:gustatory receptor for sugar taste 64e-like n=1 Tax=Epargyreus clarus TaxID=520877 RepID=UPI003C2B3B7D